MKSRAVQPGDLGPRLLKPQLIWVPTDMNDDEETTSLCVSGSFSGNSDKAYPGLHSQEETDY